MAFVSPLSPPITDGGTEWPYFFVLAKNVIPFFFCFFFLKQIKKKKKEEEEVRSPEPDHRHFVTFVSLWRREFLATQYRLVPLLKVSDQYLRSWLRELRCTPQNFELGWAA